jgi:hypothetical protein
MGFDVWCAGQNDENAGILWIYVFGERTAIGLAGAPHAPLD